MRRPPKRTRRRRKVVEALVTAQPESLAAPRADIVAAEAAERKRSIRAVPVSAAIKRERIWRIAETMAAGLYERGVTAIALAKEWKLAVATVEHMAAESSRLCDLSIGDRKRLLQLLDARMVNVALQNEPDRVQAARTLYERMGELRQRHLITPTRDPFEGWTDEELERFYATGERPPRLQHGEATR